MMYQQPMMPKYSKTPTKDQMRMTLKRRRKKRKLNQLFMHIHREIPGENELIAPFDFNAAWTFFFLLLCPIFCNMPIYFAIKGIVGCRKITLLEWLKMMLLEDGCTFYMIPEPVDKFKKKITYDPLDECYKCPVQSAAMAQKHIMDESVKHYTEEVMKVRKMKLDSVMSERSIVSKLIFTDTYFRNGVSSTFTKDSINMMWEDKIVNDADLAAVKQDVIIFLSWLKKEPANSSRSEVEHEYLTKTSYHGSFLDHHQQACQ